MSHQSLLRAAQQALLSGNAEQARQCCQQILRQQPQHLAALHLAGVAALQLGQPDAAVALLRQACSGAPGNAEFALHLGQALGAAGNLQEAREVLERADQWAPQQPDILHALALAWVRLSQPQQAVACLRQLLSRQPADAVAHRHLAHALAELGELAPAAQHYQQALQLQPADAAALAGWSDVTLRMGQPQPALDLAERAVTMAPQSWEMWFNRGNAYKGLGQMSAAVRDYDQALALGGPESRVQWNRAQALLAQEDWQRGWLAFEARRLQPWARPRSFNCAAWQGEDLAGQRLLVVAEQGLGDTLQFLRMVPWLAARGIEVVLQVQPALRALAGRLRGVAEICTLDQTPPATARWVWLLSLPRLLGVTQPQRLPQQVPLLAPLPATAAPPRPFAIGLAWQGNPAYPGDVGRSPGIAALRALAWPENVELHCLQRGGLAEFQTIPARRADRAEEIDAAGPPFVETLQLLPQLDLVICIDSSIAHLAGSMGVPTWVLLVHAPDYRWAVGREDAVWYPTVRLFRQPQPGAWQPVLAELQAALQRLAANCLT